MKVMPSHRRSLAALIAGCTLVIAPASAHAANGEAVLRDCNDNGKLDKKYSQSDYRDAIENIPTDLDEYTDCRDVIRRAQLGLDNAGSGGGSGSSGGATGGGGAAGGSASGGSTGGGNANATAALADATPEERAALEQTTAGGAQEGLRLGDEVIRPKIGVSSSTALPTPLVAVVVLLGGITLGWVGLAVRNRFFRGPTLGGQTPAPGAP